MTEQQIKEGYERLQDALVAPLDAADRVAGRVQGRRRRQRITSAVVALGAAAALVGTGLALTGGEDDDSTIAADQPPAPTSTLVMTRPDGSTYAFPDVTVTCTPPKLAGGDTLGAGRGRIWMYSPFHMTGTGEDDARITEPFLYLEAIVDKISGDRTLAWPNGWRMATEHVPLTLFVADTEGASRGNEVSTNESGAAGTVHVLEASCDPVPVLRVEVDATLGSEVEQGTLQVAGSVD